MTNKITVPGIPDEQWAGIVEKITDELTDDVPEKVVRAVELLLSGFPVGKAAKEIGVSPDTIKSWLKKYPMAAHVLADGRRYLQLWRMAQLEQQFVKAIDKSEEILKLSLHDVDVNVKLAGIQAQQLDELAKHCTEEEDTANKVERQVGKSAAALLLEERIGERFDAIVTGASDKGTWARLLEIPAEGKVIHGFEGLDVGDQVRVQLTAINVERGFIDFKTVGQAGH